ncbi:MAG: MFS transporter [Burkholderiales bacterium PBB4]|nr:MAG: MFS transporter [Burkholderiales bacterium PBB4]
MRFIMVAVLIDMISIGLMIPVLPHLVGQFTQSQADQAFWFGAVSFAFGIANFFGSPILGALSDRFGRRPVLLIGFSGLAFNFFMTAAATSLWLLVAVRLVGGGMQANISVANAYVADITPPEDRARRFGLLGAMMGLGFILGPALGGILGDIDLRLPFVASGSLAVLNWIYGYFVLPESLPQERRTPFDWRKVNPVASLTGLYQLKGVGALVAVIALSTLSQFMLHSTWVLYTTFKFGWGPHETGWSLMMVGIVNVLMQGFLLKHILKRISPQRLALVGLLTSALAYLAYGLVPFSWMLFIVILLNMPAAATGSLLQSMVSGAAGASVQGRTLGAVSSLNSMMAVLAPVIGAGLLALVSGAPRGDLQLGLPFFVGGLFQLLAFGLAILHFQHQRRLAADSTAVSNP